MIYLKEMPRLVFSPKTTFFNMTRAKGKDGVMAAFLIFFITQLIILFTYLSLGYSVNDLLLIQFGIGVFVGVFVLILTVLISSYFAWLLGGRRNVNLSLAYMGHATILNLLQQTAIALVAFWNGIIYYPFAANSSITGAVRGGPGLEAFTTMALIMSIFFFIWQLWVNGVALAMANKTTLFRGVFSYILATVVMGFVLGIVSSIFIISMSNLGYGVAVLRFTPF